MVRGAGIGECAPTWVGWDKEHSVRTRLAIKIHTTLERLFPERRIFLKSDSDTRFIRLKPEMQLIAYTGVAAIVGWTIVATAIVVMDTIGASNFRDQAKLDQQLFQDRLNAISDERDMRAAEAVAAQERFNTALAQISRMQSELLASETRRDELATGIDVIQSTLRDTMQDREAARNALAALQEETSEETSRVASSSPEPLNFMSEALEATAVERDRIYADARNAIEQRDEMELELRLPFPSCRWTRCSRARVSRQTVCSTRCAAGTVARVVRLRR